MDKTDTENRQEKHLPDVTEDCYAESQLFTLMALALRKGNDQEPRCIRICDALDCELKDVVELVKAEE